MPEIVVDDSRAPVIVVTYPDAPTIDDFRAAFEKYRAISERHPRVAYLVDFRRFDPVTAPAATRKEAAKVFERYRPILARVTVCEARVVENVLSRGIVTAFDWITPQKWPCANFARATEAEAWIAKQLAKPAR
jgi:hypothetical protein